MTMKDIDLLTPAQKRQIIADEMRALDLQEAQARADYSNEMRRIEGRREMLEEMWRKTYESGNQTG